MTDEEALSPEDLTKPEIIDQELKSKLTERISQL
jgi:hypothetical protein